MPTKLLLTYDVKDDMSEDYRQFVLGEFLPAVQRMGLAVIEVWLTVYGNYPERQTELLCRDEETMWQILRSKEWGDLEQRLAEYVSDLGRKVIPYQPGFQM
jgi:hypothetical protein